MGHQPPERALAGRRADGGGGLHQADDPLYGRAAFEFKIALLIAERKPRRQIAISAQSPHGEDVGVGLNGPLREVDHRQIDLDTLVVLLSRSPPMGHPERLALVVDGGVAIGVERFELEHRIGFGVDADDLLDREDFSSVRTGDVRHDLIFVLALVEQDGLGGLFEEVNDGATVEFEGLRIDAEFEVLAAIEHFKRRDQEHDLGAILDAAHPGQVESADFEEQVLFRESEVFLNQPVGFKGAARVRQHALVRRKADRPQDFFGLQDDRLETGVRRIADQNLHAVREQQLVNRVGQIALGRDEEPQVLQGHLLKRHALRGFELDSQRPNGVVGLDRRIQPVGRFPVAAGDGDGKDRRIEASAELARHALYSPRVQDAFTRNLLRRSQSAGFRIEVELDDRHRRNGPQVMRIKDIEQRLGELGELIIDFEVDAGGEKSKAFEHALDVGILALVSLEH